MRKIHVSQGHEKSISLEVFIKSFLSLNKSQQNKFKLFVFKEDLETNLNFLKLTSQIKKDHVDISGSKLECVFLEKSSLSNSFESLKRSISALSKDDLLLTLPTSKDQLSEGKLKYTGHTDYFRSEYKDDNLVMLFASENLNLAVLTEHIPLSKVESSISEELVTEKLKKLQKSGFSFKRFIFSGINPHCGESDLIGSADSDLLKILSSLRKKSKDLEIIGPISGDTLLANTIDVDKTDCFISSFHDQGLSPFKAISGFRAANITIGLPFLRLSPDHGTAFDLYGKNTANYFGTLFTMKLALRELDKYGN